MSEVRLEKNERGCFLFLPAGINVTIQSENGSQTLLDVMTHQVQSETCINIRLANGQEVRYNVNHCEIRDFALLNPLGQH